jgi:hypothetical protein
VHAQVVKFDDGPLDGVAAYSTLGLSQYVLAVPGKAPIRIELLMMVRRGLFERYVPSLMQQLAEEMIHEGRAPLRGEVIGPRGLLDPDTRLEAFLVYGPVYQPKEFAVCEDADSGPIIIAWLVPLFPDEASFADTHGWEALDSLLVEHDPDVADWLRPPLPVHSSGGSVGDIGR